MHLVNASSQHFRVVRLLYQFYCLKGIKTSDEGLTLETSGFYIFLGGNSTFINSFDKTKFL